MTPLSKGAADLGPAGFIGGRSLAPASSSSRLAAATRGLTAEVSTHHADLSDVGVAFCAAVALLRVEDDLADPDDGRGDLDALVLAAELECLLQRQLPVRDQPDQL